MTYKEVKLVKSSWRLLKGVDAATIGDVFYSKLFQETPSLRKLFDKDMTSQHVKLIGILNYIVINIDKLDENVEEIASTVKHYIDFEIKSNNYLKVGEALFWTLEKGLGYDWNESVSKAWQNCYNLLLENMKDSEKKHKSFFSI